MPIINKLAFILNRVQDECHQIRNITINNSSKIDLVSMMQSKSALLQVVLIA